MLEPGTWKKPGTESVGKGLRGSVGQAEKLGIFDTTVEQPVDDIQLLYSKIANGKDSEWYPTPKKQNKKQESMST